MKGLYCCWCALWFSQSSLGSFITISQLSGLWKPVSGKWEQGVHWSQWNFILHRKKASILEGQALQVCCRWSKVQQEYGCNCERCTRFTLHASGCKSLIWIKDDDVIWLDLYQCHFNFTSAKDASSSFFKIVFTLLPSFDCPSFSSSPGFWPGLHQPA